MGDIRIDGGQPAGGRGHSCCAGGTGALSAHGALKHKRWADRGCIDCIGKKGYVSRCRRYPANLGPQKALPPQQTPYVYFQRLSFSPVIEADCVDPACGAQGRVQAPICDRTLPSCCCTGAALRIGRKASGSTWWRGTSIFVQRICHRAETPSLQDSTGSGRAQHLKGNGGAYRQAAPPKFSLVAERKRACGLEDGDFGGLFNGRVLGRGGVGSTTNNVITCFSQRASRGPYRVVPGGEFAPTHAYA